MRVSKGQIYLNGGDGHSYIVHGFDKYTSGKMVVLELRENLYSGFLRYRLIDFEEDIKSGYWILDIKNEKSRKFKKQMRKI